MGSRDHGMVEFGVQIPMAPLGFQVRNEDAPKNAPEIPNRRALTCSRPDRETPSMTSGGLALRSDVLAPHES